MKKDKNFPRLGVISLYRWEERTRWGDRCGERERCKLYTQKVLSILKKCELELYGKDQPVTSEAEALEETRRLLSQGIEVLFLHLFGFSFPSTALRVAREIEIPIILYSHREEVAGSLGILIASGSGLSQIGYSHLRIYGGIEEESTQKKILAYARAVSTKARIKGQLYGMFGGRALGIVATTFDPAQYQEIFGVDVDHFDQIVIVKKSEMIEEQRVEKYFNWLLNTCAQVSGMEEEKNQKALKQAIRFYLATKDLVKEFGLDFIAIKCQAELLTTYGPQCLTAGFLPDPYDGEGEKEPTVISCEADADGGLTMQILKLVSGGKPTLFLDLCHIFPDGVIRLQNCGSQSTWYATRSKDIKENMKKVYIEVSVGEEGLQHVHPVYTVAPCKATFARLYRVNRKYRMAIVPGEFIDYSKNVKHHKFQLNSFAKFDVDLERLVSEAASHHFQAVEGDYVAELSYLCDLYGIEKAEFK